MLNRPQINGTSDSATNNNINQPLLHLMVRAPVPGHVREQLRSSMPSQLEFQRPQPNYEDALTDMAQKILDRYTRPSQSQTEYAQRQTHVAEYGRPPPTITPPPTTDLMIDPSLRQQQPSSPSRPSPVYAQLVPSPRRLLRILLGTGSEAAEGGTPAHLPGRRLATAPVRRSTPTPAQTAENMAFEINARTGLNGFGAPCGYMPADFVDRIPGAWDAGWRMLWVPSWMREERRDERTS